jgi:hypothetical protein
MGIERKGNRNREESKREEDLKSASYNSRPSCLAVNRIILWPQVAEMAGFAPMSDVKVEMVNFAREGFCCDSAAS